MPVQSQHTTWTGDYVESQVPRRHIVIADDDPSLVRLLEEDLQSEGYQVHCAYDGQMAIRLAHQVHPQLIILDVNMPMTNGLKALRYLREMPDTAPIPVIFVTSEHSKDIYPVIDKNPRVAYLRKPFGLDILNSLVRKFLELYPVA